MTYLRHFYDLCMTLLRPSYDLCMAFLWPLYDLIINFVWPYYDFCMTLVLMTFVWPKCEPPMDFCMTFVWLLPPYQDPTGQKYGRMDEEGGLGQDKENITISKSDQKNQAIFFLFWLQKPGFVNVFRNNEMKKYYVMKIITPKNIFIILFFSSLWKFSRITKLRIKENPLFFILKNRIFNVFWYSYGCWTKGKKLQNDLFFFFFF